MSELELALRPPTRVKLPPIKALGFSLNKRRFLPGFLPGRDLVWIDDPSAVRHGDTVAVWASSPWADAVELPGVEVLRIEDGFLRSVGLGAQLARPLSWVVDGRGIHYDPSRPSDLEVLLESGDLDPSLVSRAARLRQSIVAAGISKYNVGARDWAGLTVARERSPIVLVVGQVETDASIRTGARAVPTNAALLAAARATHPQACLVYKPHPDVVAGLRNPGEGESEAAARCDEVIQDAPIAALLDAVDVVHVNTSLTGFEALLRGKPVHCHGLPFYAGWGLTQDREHCPRRTRRRSLDELVAAALIAYPRYVSRSTGQPCSAEEALSELIRWRRGDSGALRWWHHLLRPMLRHD